MHFEWTAIIFMMAAVDDLSNLGLFLFSLFDVLLMCVLCCTTNVLAEDIKVV